MSEQTPSPKILPFLRKRGIDLSAWMVMVTFAIGILAIVLTCGSWSLNAWERSALGPLQRAACDGNVAECERLVKSGIPVDAMDDQGDTALNWAMYYCKTSVVRKLIELGADSNHINRRADGGFTPLMYTATPFRGHNVSGTQEERNEIARLLIQHGADVNHTIGDGQTTLHFAAANKNAELVRMLLAAGAKRNVASNQGYTPLDIAKFPDYAPNDAVITALQEPAR